MRGAGALGIEHKADNASTYRRPRHIGVTNPKMSPHQSIGAGDLVTHIAHELPLAPFSHEVFKERHHPVRVYIVVVVVVVIIVVVILIFEASADSCVSMGCDRQLN